jgi:hypothetical protein
VVESADVMRCVLLLSRFYIFGRKEFGGRSGAKGRKERRSANASVRGGTDLEFFFSLSKLWTTASDLVHVAGWVRVMFPLRGCVETRTRVACFLHMTRLFYRCQVVLWMRACAFGFPERFWD